MSEHPADGEIACLARELSREERLEVFRRATRTLPKWYAQEIRRGMSDAALTEALKQVLGIQGGSGGPGMLDVAYQGAGLKIWGGWEWPNLVTDTPLFSGEATVAMARDVYDIADPDSQQLTLL